MTTRLRDLIAQGKSDAKQQLEARRAATKARNQKRRALRTTCKAGLHPRPAHYQPCRACAELKREQLRVVPPPVVEDLNPRNVKVTHNSHGDVIRTEPFEKLRPFLTLHERQQLAELRDQFLQLKINVSERLAGRFVDSTPVPSSSSLDQTAWPADLRGDL